MKAAEWKKVLEAEVEKAFAEEKHQVNGFEDSAPSIKLSTLSDMYDREPEHLGQTKAKAYRLLADGYSAQAAWN